MKRVHHNIRVTVNFRTCVPSSKLSEDIVRRVAECLVEKLPDATFDVVTACKDQEVANSFEDVDVQLEDVTFRGVEKNGDNP